MRKRGWKRRLISLPFTAQFSSFSSFYLSLSRLRGRLAFPICVTPESQITGPRTPFCFAHVSQQVKSLEARRAEERGRYAQQEETDGASAERYDGKIRRLRIRISFRLGTKEHLPSRCNIERNSMDGNVFNFGKIKAGKL